LVTGTGKLGRSKLGLGEVGLGKLGSGKVGRWCCAEAVNDFTEFTYRPTITYRPSLLRPSLPTPLATTHQKRLRQQ